MNTESLIANEKFEDFHPNSSSSSSKKSVFHVASRFPSTLSREICADVCVIKISVAPSPSGKDACVYVYLCEISKNSSQKYQFIWFFSHRDFFFSKLKQYLRRCSSIVRTYFETTLLFDKKFFKDRIWIATNFEFSIKFFDYLIFTI
jgi:hypothetical protein